MQASLSKRGQHRKSTEPLREISAQVSPSPTNP